MKVIIEHDDYCNISEKMKESWIRAFENLRKKTKQDGLTLDQAKQLANEWAELARVADQCNCGAAQEIERRKKSEKESMVAIHDGEWK